MKFSVCGRLLVSDEPLCCRVRNRQQATAGQDKVVRVWVLKDAFEYFENMRKAQGQGDYL